MLNKQNKFTKSFYDWCIDNNRQDLLDRWDYDLNAKSPKEVGFSSNKLWWFKCTKHPEHHSEQIKINSCTSGRGLIDCHQCESFGQWCIDNDHRELLDRWDYKLNNKNPFDVSYMSHSKYYFKCPFNMHKSSQKIIYSVVHNSCGIAHCVGCKSFGQWACDKFGSSFFDTYWNINNTVEPYDIPMHSNDEKIIINCIEKDYHKEYITTPDAFVSGRRCPYCGHAKLHLLDSLGVKYPEVIDIWSDKNVKTPYEYTSQNNQKVWWKCLCGKHSDYRRAISDGVRREFRCPRCVQELESSVLQNKVAQYITNKYDFQLLHEHQCTIRPVNPKTKMPMPYDNEIVELKLIIEVNGAQHYHNYMYKSLYHLSEEDADKMLEKRQRYDKYKIDYALCNGYSYLTIPYWEEKDNQYKHSIDEKIKQLLSI